MESRPLNPEFKINPENFHPCSSHIYIETKCSESKCCNDAKNNFLSQMFFRVPTTVDPIEMIYRIFYLEDILWFE